MSSEAGTEDDGEPEGFEASADEKECLGRKEWAICVATFYDDLAERLVGGAMEGFAEGGVTMASVQTFEVPGEHNRDYLRAKRDKLGHTLHHQGLPLDEDLFRAERESDRRKKEVESRLVAGLVEQRDLVDE